MRHLINDKNGKTVGVWFDSSNELFFHPELAPVEHITSLDEARNTCNLFAALVRKFDEAAGIKSGF